MKKALSILLILVLVLSLCACGGQKNPLLGKWKHHDSIWEFSDRIITVTSEKSSYSKTYAYELPEEGFIKLNDNAHPSGWSTYAYEIDGDTLRIYEGETKVFERVR